MVLVYFHFPGGKEELATEVTLVHAADAIAQINRAAGSARTAAESTEAFMGSFVTSLSQAITGQGVRIAPIVLEATPASTQLSDVTRRGFQDLISTLAARLAEKNIPDGRAVQLATSAVTSMEGALMLGRVLRSTAPFDTAIAATRRKRRGRSRHFRQMTSTSPPRKDIFR